MFKGRKLVIATMHGKEKVIAPILEKILSVNCFVPSNIDTDSLGTFSGEIDRKETVLKTLRQKCLLAMEMTNCDLGIASEGSFGAHPSIFFAQADDEVLLLIDKKNDLEILAREISMETNFNGKAIENEQELLEFASLVKFPSHAIILKPAEKEFSKIIKGITNKTHLLNSYQDLILDFGKAYAETDMRAHFNPTRMKVIELATHKLVKNILSICPKCKTPGFSVTEIKSGLPCEWCNSPTRSTLSFLYSCKKCNYIKEEFYPHKKTKEDPMYCDFCNP